ATSKSCDQGVKNGRSARRQKRFQCGQGRRGDGSLGSRPGGNSRIHRSRLSERRPGDGKFRSQILGRQHRLSRDRLQSRHLSKLIQIPARRSQFGKGLGLDQGVGDWSVRRQVKDSYSREHAPETGLKENDGVTHEPDSKDCYIEGYHVIENTDFPATALADT